MSSAEEKSNQHFIRFLLSRNSELDGERIAKVIPFLKEAHRDQFRKSGAPYTEHPLEVAKILAGLKLDTDTIIAGLLHDVVEDTEYSLAELTDMFGSEVAFMVDAVTKISNIQQSVLENTKEEQKIATYRKFLVSMAEDPRVIMIKLADRLHNLRTLHYMRPEKRKEIAKESLEIYAPLTHRFGLHRIKWELEDLSLKYIDPEGYKNIIDKLQQSRSKREAYIGSVIMPLEMKMALEDLDCSIQGRPKHVYSIYQKTKARNCTVDDLFDLFAIRILVETIQDCYLALGYVHNLWTPLQSRFKDYIATPKPNLYQSLHTTVIGPEGKMVEVQIRTHDMDQTAEHGFAAHWAYKIDEDDVNNLEWLKQLAQAQSEITDSKEFLDFLRLDLTPTEIVVFTPKGEAVSLPMGATVLDFAFAVHSELGLHCVGAKVDEQVVSINATLNHGNTVYILRNPEQEPSKDWLNIVVTHKAKLEIRRKIRTSDLEQKFRIGKTIYERELRNAKILPLNYPPPEKILDHFGIETMEAFYESVGIGSVTPDHLGDFLLGWDDATGHKRKDRSLLQYFLGKDPAEVDAEKVVVRAGSPSVTFAPCCGPVLGDKIVGVMQDAKGLFVHKDTCKVARKVAAKHRIEAIWDEKGTESTLTKIEVNANNREGLLLDIATIFHENKTEVVNASIVTVSEQVRNRFTLNVYDLTQLLNVIQKIQELPNVKKVRRL